MAAPGPDNLDMERHLLSVGVQHKDGLRLTTALTLLEPVTREADIQRIHFDHCTACHGSRGSARSMTEFAAWRLEITELVYDVETGRMPCGASMLSPSQLVLIRIWQDTGLRER